MSRQGRPGRHLALALAGALALAWLAGATSAWAEPTLTLPACVSAGSSGRLTGSGFPPGLVRFTIEGPSGRPVEIGTFRVGSDGGLALAFQNTGGPIGPYVVKATSDPSGTSGPIGGTPTGPGLTVTSGLAVGGGGGGGNSTSAPVVLATATMCAAAPPKLECIPPIGPPGFVTLAVGSGFPPNTAVVLAWRPGTAGARTVTDARGNLSVPVLVMHRDILGARSLVAVAGTAASAPTASAPFLVVPASLGPPEVRGPQPELVFRR